MPEVGLPQGGAFFTQQQFKTLNTKAQRTAIEDEEFAWLENLIPIGPGNLRSVWGPSAALYTAAVGRTIINFSPFNIGSTFYHFVLLDNGAADIVNAQTGVVNHLWAAGTFTGSLGVATAQWGSQYLIVIDPAKGYFIWDGTASYFGTAGGSPNTASLAPIVKVTNAGTGYTSAPTVAASGGHGTGATFTAVVNNGSVTSVTITNAGTGYQVGDTVTLGFSGGGGTGAAATVTLMPTGLSGTDIEVFQSRVWIINGATIQLSAPASVSDFASTDGASAFTATDSVLRVAFTAFRQASGFLYPIADSSISVINNVVTNVSAVTTFNNNNVDPQVGTIWRDSTLVFGRAIMLASQSGVYGLYGGAAEKVSPQLDGVFQKLVANFTPSAALALIFNIKVYIILLKITDPFGITRPVMFAWDGQKWFALSQGNDNIKQIATLNINATQQCWATDGTTLFQCFTTPSSTLVKRYQSKLWQGKSFVFTKEANRFAIEAQDNQGSGLTFTASIDTDRGSLSKTFNSFGGLIFLNSSNGVLQFQNNLLGNLNFVTAGNTITWNDISWSGKYMGLTFSSTSMDFTIVNVSLLYLATTAY